MKAPRKQTKKEPKIKIIEPLKVKTITPPFIKEKREYPMDISVVKKEYPMMIETVTKIILPEGHVRCIVLKDYQGMMDFHKKDDIIDLPERRFKSESFRGLVKEYKGDRQPNKRR